MEKKETIKQVLLRKMYPFIRNLGKKGKNGTILVNSKNIQAISSFYDQKAVLNNGKSINFNEFKGKKVLLTNTASNCGYTAQYSELQTLHERYANNLIIVAFPANDFANQEKSNDDEISQFCQLNYSVTFNIARKGSVVKGSNQHNVFKWLTNPNQNGWNNHYPDWNFGKYLVNENGNLTHYFGPSISPLDDNFINAITNN